MEALDRVADKSLIKTGLIPCQALVRVFDGEILLAESADAFTTAWPESNGHLLVPESDVMMDRLAAAGTNADGVAVFTAGYGAEAGADPVAWRDNRSAPSGKALIGFVRKPLRIVLQDQRPGAENGVATLDRFPRWGDMSDLIRLMDVRPVQPGVFEAPTYGDVRRNVVEGGQLLGDAIVAAGKTDPDKHLISAQTIFSRPAVFDRPLRLDVHESRKGRSYTTLTIETTQDGKPIATSAVLMDAGSQDLTRHHVDFPDVAGPDDAPIFDYGVIGRETRIVNGDYSPDPDRVGPPEIHAWLRHREQPEKAYMRQAVLAQPTTHWTIAASMLPHKGYGEVQAHRTISTGVLSSTIYFHEDPDLADWLLYSTRATYSGHGLAQGEGRIHSRAGQLVATFAVQVMVRGFPKSEDGSDMKDDRLM